LLHFAKDWIVSMPWGLVAVANGASGRDTRPPSGRGPRPDGRLLDAPATAELPQRLLQALTRMLGAVAVPPGGAHPAAADGRQSALFEAAKEQMS
jgi:hypothetical protein